MKFPKCLAMMMALVLIFTSGCAHKVQMFETFSYPEIGNVATKGVGENLFVQGTGQLERQLVIPETVVIGSFTLSKGKYPFGGENSTRIKFSRDPQDIYLYPSRPDKTLCLDAGHFSEQCALVDYSVEKVLSHKSINSFEQNLLYNGKIGNKITLGYREFNGGMARAAFSNEVSYDLSESQILGYKGARIEVLKATNTEITYKVLSVFNGNP